MINRLFIVALLASASFSNAQVAVDENVTDVAFEASLADANSAAYQACEGDVQCIIEYLTDFVENKESNTPSSAPTSAPSANGLLGQGNPHFPPTSSEGAGSSGAGNSGLSEAGELPILTEPSEAGNSALPPPEETGLPDPSETVPALQDPPETVPDMNNLALCSAQAECIDFTIKKRDSSSCALAGNCAVEVCMILDTDKEGCSKEGPISHLCAANDADGCAAYGADGLTPLTGKGFSSDCSLTGEYGTAAFDGTCEPTSNKVVMCQEAQPGQTVYWALKDSNVEDTSFYDFTGTFTFNTVDSTTCSPTISCVGGTTQGVQCANPQNMYESTRVWRYTIPSGGTCNLCSGSPALEDPGALPDFGSAELLDFPDLPDAPELPGDVEESLGGPEPPSTTSEAGDGLGLPEGPALPDTPEDPNSVNPEVADAGGQGDPHFKTWRNEHFEFHGQCDLVLASDPDFNDGLGLDVQIRTKVVRYWSYIKSVAIRIGTDILEIEGNGGHAEGLRYWINMEFMGAVKTVGGFPVIFKSKKRDKLKETILIDFDSKYPGTQIEIQVWKEFVKVNFPNPTAEAFGNTVGILGDFHTGKTVGRDGVTVFDDYLLLGEEWQVLPADNMLFHSTEEPQFPRKCIEPEESNGMRRRRLGEMTVTEEEAEKACAHLKDKIDQKDCLYDVLALQSLDMAGAY